jgi:hypothetical protein
MIEKYNLLPQKENEKWYYSKRNGNGQPLRETAGAQSTIMACLTQPFE